MDRSWMYAKRDFLYLRRLDEFLDSAINHQRRYKDDQFICPCSVCRNRKKVNSRDELREHLIVKGFVPDYSTWIWHGETDNDLSITSDIDIETNDGDGHQIDDGDHNDDEMMENVASGDNVEPENLDGLMNDLEKDLVECPVIFQKMVSRSKQPLYPDCSEFTLLSAVLDLYTLKAESGWSDKSFTFFLALVSRMLPKDNELPTTTYQCKKMLCSLATKYEKIHACRNDCVLYRNEHSELKHCPRCGESRYKIKDNDGKKGGPVKTLWYLPIIPRFKRLFANKKTAEYMVWHDKGRIKDGKLRHVADAPQWRTFDRTYPRFGLEARNLRLGLCTDGINPFGTLSTQHSCWPVMLIIYNIPPWLTTKSKYIMLTLLISGPKQPGNDIDVYLTPLIEDLKLLWNEGVSVFDAVSGLNFQMHAMLYCTINDFPAYGNLSGYRLKTDKGCPICMDDTESDWLENSGKYAYMGHRRFLPDVHPYRRKKKAFYGKTERRKAPLFLSGKAYYDQVKNITREFGKPYVPLPNGIYHTKRSIFWELPYWQHLSVRHCIDVMHVEKNVFDSLIGTLLNMPNKTKDGVKARNDMFARGRVELKPIENGKRMYIPPSCTTLSKKEKTIICESLKGVKVPHGYSSNISRLVSLKDCKLVGMKSHDCHVMLTQLLPVAIRSVLPKHVRQVITKLCLFFSAINSKDIEPDTLDELQADVVVTLCEMEMYFPIAFFDIMVHLIVHLVREIKMCGPVFQRNMWAREREMGTYKRRMKNHYRPEGSIVEGTIACETIQFCVDYMTNGKSIGVHVSRHEGRLLGKGTLGKKYMTLDRDSLRKAHMYVLYNMKPVHRYLDEHLDLLRQQNPRKRDDWLLNKQNQTFVEWFTEHITQEMSKESHDISETLRWLAYGPKQIVTSYEGYDINGFCFYTSRQDSKSTMQNCGVIVVASSDECVGRSKELENITKPYYGIIEEIWELECSTNTETLFRCKWADCDKGVTVDDMGFILVNFNVVGHINDPFILGSQAKQVFYMEDPSDKLQHVVRHGKRRILGVEGVVDEEEYDQFDELSSISSERLSVQDLRDETYVRRDHDEGWFENV